MRQKKSVTTTKPPPAAQLDPNDPADAELLRRLDTPREQYRTDFEDLLLDLSAEIDR